MSKVTIDLISRQVSPIIIFVLRQSIIILKQGGNSNLDCIPRTAVVAMSDGGVGGRGEGGP